MAAHPQLDGLMHFRRAIPSELMSLVGDDGYLATANVMVDLQFFVDRVQERFEAVAVVDWVDRRVDWRWGFQSFHPGEVVVGLVGDGVCVSSLCLLRARTGCWSQRRL